MRGEVGASNQKERWSRTVSVDKEEKGWLPLKKTKEAHEQRFGGGGQGRNRI